MKTSVRSRISLLLLFSLVLTLLGTAFLAVGVSAATDPKKIDRVIVDFRSEAALAESGGNIYIHTPKEAEPDPLTGGKYSFSEKEAAVWLEYHETDKQIPNRLMFRTNTNDQLSTDYKFVAIVYKAVTSASYTMKLSNTPNQGVAITSDGKDAIAKGDWKVVIGDISVADGNGKSILGRWLDKNINTLSFDTTDKNAEFYLKEVGFFKTKADAEAYYNGIDIAKAPSAYLDIPDPVIMSFNGDNWLSGNAKFTDFDANTEGEYEFKTVDGVKALRLKYSPYGSFANFRTMPAFKQKETVTDQHRYVRITYMTTEPLAYQITMLNNKNNSDKAILVENTAQSKGQWITSNVVDIGAGDLLTRYVTGMHCTIGFTSTNENSEIYIKEVGFFATPEQAYAYYGDEEQSGGGSYVALNFVGANASGTVNRSNAAYGVSSENAATGALDITYAESTNHNVNYMAKVLFGGNGIVNATQKFVRVLYAADHPAGVDTAIMRIQNDKVSETAVLVPSVKDTNGEFVLSSTVLLPNDMMHRFAGSGDYNNAIHNSIHVTTKEAGGTYSIKAIYFFADKASADKFEIPDESAHKLTVNGNDISKYQIVVPADKPFAITVAAEKLVAQIKYLTGITVPVVTDEAPVSEYEIQVGQSTRPLTTSKLSTYNDGEEAYKRYTASLEGNTLVITSALPYACEDAVDILLSSFLGQGMTNLPEEIKLDSTCKFDGKSATLGRYEKWATVNNSLSAQYYFDKFDSDEGYFTEDNNAQIFNIANGVMSGKATDEAITYVHVFEKNASAEAKLSYAGAGKNADFGLMLRYTGKDAFVKAGYDFNKGCWYILSREGADFYPTTVYGEKFALTEGTVYNVKFTVDGETALLTVNGVDVLKADGITQVTPGKIGVYAEDITLTVDDFNAVLLSGLGTIIRNVYHTLLPDDEYREGGSVFEMKDGSINYTHHYGVNFKSIDNGKSWTRTDAWTTYNGYVNMLRLVNGDFMKVSSEGGWMYSYTSSDEGKTWTRGGQITQHPFRGDKSINAGAGNMNDKINQSASGRIFYSQNYETTTSQFNEPGEKVNRKVFCEFFWSDDNGKTWQKSDTTSWTIPGNETQTHFGECKILECADGTIRMYNSWNRYGCVVYSDSTDGGKTFGPLQMMPEFPCACSSMQFYRDPYGETDTTYYMIWVNTQDNPVESTTMPRSSISLAKSTDGKTWVFLGDIWRWQSNYRYGTTGAILNHVVDPFIKTTKDYVIVGTGLAEHMARAGDNSYHGAQRQHIWSIRKDTLVGEPLGTFTDVTTVLNYYDAVKFVCENGLFNGTSATTFEPNTPMTRSMFVTVLGRLDGADVSKYTTPTFADVVAGQWYTSYVEWAAANGVVNGIGNGLYGINDNITVEQACVMLARYNGSKNVKASGKTLADFNDTASISTWAADAVKWAVENGIYEGVGTSLCPTAPASRGLIATMFKNYVFTCVYGK